MSESAFAAPPVATKGIGSRDRSPLASAAWMLSAAMGLSGLLTYAFLVLAARTLGAAAYGRIGVLWAAMFIVAIVLFRPLEQTASRSIAHRLASGEEAASVVRSVTLLAIGVVVGLTIVFAAAGSLLDRRLFGGDRGLTVLLFFGIVFYGLSYLVRGLVGGIRWFDGYGINLVADGLGRLVLAVPLVFLASQRLAGVAVAGAGLIAAVVPLALGRARLKPLFASGEGTPFHPRGALGFALPAGTIAASDQLLINGAPILVMLSGGPHATRTAGIAFAATMLVRAPVYVFQGVAASLLPNLTHLRAVEGKRLGAEVGRISAFLFGVGGLIAVGCFAAGPLALRLLYGGEYHASRTVFLALGVGVALYLGAATLSQALLAADQGRRAAAAWLVAAVALVGSYAALPGSELLRVALSFAVGAAVLLVALIVCTYRSLWAASA